MLLKEIILRNFKSFKNASIKFSPQLTAVVGPNGSGKSNVCDSLKFVFGEKRLKRLRAKKVSDLIHRGESSSSVTMVLEENGKFHEIKRSIRKDGKIKYEVNGKSVNFSSYKEFLRRKGFKGIDTFIIAQGEVTRIVLMNPKERRSFIDEISGIAEFEEKKKEALRELSVVDERIKDTNIIIGEKLKYLEQLKREKEVAERYEEKKKRLDNIRATLINRKIKSIEAKLDEIREKESKLLEKKQTLERKLEEITQSIEQIYKDRSMLDKEIEAKTQRSEIYRKMENLKTEKAVLEEKLRNEEEKLNSLKERIKEKEEEMGKLDEIEEQLKKEREYLEKELKNIKIKKKEKFERKSIKLKAKLTPLEEELKKIDEEIIKAEERLKSLNQSIEDNKKVLELFKGKEETIDYDREIKEIEIKIMDTFKKEKTLNNQIAEIDRKMVKIREKLSLLRHTVGSSRINPVDVFLSDLVKENKIEGFYGRVIDLIEFDDKFAYAVEAAGGSRLTYYVVQNLDVAKKAIEFIKKSNLGRATFIPLDELKVPPLEKTNELMVRSVVRSSLSLPGIEKMIDFVFSSTIIADNFSKARKLIGKHRIVTLDGELFEKTAVVSGGRGKGTIIAKKTIEQKERELEELVERRKELISELNEVREDISNLRSRKTYLENKKKEMENIKKEMEQKEQRKKEIELYINKAKDEVVNLEEKLNELKIKKGKLLPELNRLREQVKKEEELEERVFGKELSEREEQLKKKISAEENIKNIDKKLNEIKEKKIEIAKTTKNLIEELEKESVEIRKIEDKYRILSSEIVQLEEEFSKKEEEIRALMEKSREIEEKLRELSQKEKLIREGLGNAEKIMNKIEVEKATLSTRLEDLREEIAKFPEFIEVDGREEDLEEELNKLEKEINDLGEINFAAKELYYKLYDEVGEIKEKLDKLKVEKDKIIELIAEIDERKKQSFFSHLEKINKYFKELFKNITNFGEGSLYLDDPENPFESGLQMKLLRNNTEIPLESLSGGEQTIMALLFIFALQRANPSPLYVLDEVDAALDKLNSKRLAELIRNFSQESQMIIISHNDTVISSVDTIIGITKREGVSKAVQIKSEFFGKEKK